MSNVPSVRQGQENITDLMPKNWNTSDATMVAVNQVLNMSSQVTGTYANIPILCKGLHCPYLNTCELHCSGTDVQQFNGQRCPVEIAKVIRLYQLYMKSLDVDESNMVDVGLIKELVDLDMILERVNKKMAEDPDVTEEVITLLNQRTGDTYGRQDIKRILDLKQSVQARKDKVLTLLNSTRKDKADAKANKIVDPSVYSAQLLKRFAEFQANNTIDQSGEVVYNVRVEGE